MVLVMTQAPLLSEHSFYVRPSKLQESQYRGRQHGVSGYRPPLRNFQLSNRTTPIFDDLYIYIYIYIYIYTYLYTLAALAVHYHYDILNPKP